MPRGYVSFRSSSLLIYQQWSPWTSPDISSTAFDRYSRVAKRLLRSGYSPTRPTAGSTKLCNCVCFSLALRTSSWSTKPSNAITAIVVDGTDAVFLHCLPFWSPSPPTRDGYALAGSSTTTTRIQHATTFWSTPRTGATTSAPTLARPTFCPSIFYKTKASSAATCPSYARLR